MKKQLLSGLFALLIVSNLVACSRGSQQIEGTGTITNNDTTHKGDTELMPPFGDLNIPIDKTALNPDMSAFVAVPESISLQKNPAKVITDYSSTKETYDGCICVVANNSNVWVKNGKYTSDYKFIWDGVHILGPAPTLAAFANMAFTYDETTKTASIGNITAKAGKKYILIDGMRYDSESENTVIDGVLYLPLNEFVRYGMKKFYGESNKGFGVISTEEKPYHLSTKRSGLILKYNGEYTMMMAYLVLDRYNAATLQEMFDKNIKGTPYPRIATIKEDVSRYKELIEKDDFIAEMSGYVLQQADEILTQKVKPTVQGGSIAGVPSATIPEIMYYAYYMTGNHAYIEKAIAIVEPILDLNTWCASSHMLSTSSCCMYLAKVYDVFRDELTQKQRDDIANALINRGILAHSDYMMGRMGNDWPTRDSNWNVICNVGPMYAAMVLLGEGYDDAMLYDCLEKAQVSLGYSMHYFSPDGCGWEGSGYTNYTLSYVTVLLEGLNNFFGDTFGMMDYPGFEGVGRSLAMTTGKENNWTIHCEDTPVPYNTTQNMFFTKYYGDYVGQRLNIEQIYKFPAAMKLHSYLAMKYYLPGAPESVEYPKELDVLYTSSQLGFSRNAWGGKTKTVIGVHGGYNMDSGCQVDIGNFFYEYKGVVFADDPGIENYALAYTKSYAARAEGANVWVVNPDSSYGQSLEGYGDLRMVESKADGVIYTLDLSSAYEGYVESALRGFKLSDDRIVFTVQDEIQPFKGENDFYWFWHTLAEISIDEDDRSVSLVKDGVVCKIYFDSNVDFTITKQDVLTSLPESPVVEGQNQMPHSAKMHKIVVNFKSNGEPITFRATAAPFGKNVDRGALTPIGDWTIQDN